MLHLIVVLSIKFCYNWPTNITIMKDNDFVPLSDADYTIMFIALLPAYKKLSSPVNFE